MPAGDRRSSGFVNYFRGDRSQWRTRIPLYSRIVYRRLWSGIDLLYTGPRGRLESTYVVSPGADPTRIAVRYDGARTLRRGPGGSLAIVLRDGVLREGSPRAFQVRAGRRVTVPVRYELHGRVAGFRVGLYDRRLPLVIDPPSFVYAGFFGTSSYDGAAGIAVDSDGNAYIAGETLTTLPAPLMAVNDPYVAKINPAGTGLVYLSYVGGVDADLALGVAVDANGSAYVTGRTHSSESEGFPVTVGPDLTFNGAFGDQDAFVAKLSPDGSDLEYAGYIGGSRGDVGTGIAVDSDGNAYVDGYTQSRHAEGFPLAAGPDLTFNSAVGDYDAFVAKVKADGTGLDYAGYLGGLRNDFANGIAVDSNGNAYVAGSTDNTYSPVTFPATVGPDLTADGKLDGFVAKIKTDGTGLVYAGYLGSSANGIAVDSGGNAYVAGHVVSAQEFPATTGPDVTRNGSTDAYVAKVKADGTGVDYAGYIGGNADESGYAIAIDSDSSAYMTGYTYSPETTFPAVDGPDLTLSSSLGRGDAFAAKVEADGSGLVYAGYIGGSQWDVGNGIAVDSDGNAYVAGDATSTEAQGFPVTVGPDLTYNGAASDAFVAKISASSGDATPPETTIDSVPANPTSLPTASFNFRSSEPRSTFECSLDDAPFEACTTPRTYTGVVARSHTFRVRAVDPAANLDPTPALTRWTNGRIPKSRITARPASPSKSNDASFSFNADDLGARFQCALDGALFDECSSPSDYTGLANGSHNFAVRAIDAANRAGKPTAYGWTIDTISPDTTIVKHPPTTTASTAAAFTFGATEKATFVCRIDVQPFAPCKASIAFKNLSRASHTVQAKAIDSAGNTDPTPATFTWTIT